MKSSFNRHNPSGKPKKSSLRAQEKIFEKVRKMGNCQEILRLDIHVVRIEGDQALGRLSKVSLDRPAAKVN